MLCRRRLIVLRIPLRDLTLTVALLRLRVALCGLLILLLVALRLSIALRRLLLIPLRILVLLLGLTVALLLIALILVALLILLVLLCLPAGLLIAGLVTAEGDAIRDHNILVMLHTVLVGVVVVLELTLDKDHSALGEPLGDELGGLSPCGDVDEIGLFLLALGIGAVYCD